MKTFYLHLPKTTIAAAIFAVALTRSANGASTNYTWNVSAPSPTSTWNTPGNWLAAAGFPGAGGDTADTVTFNNTGVSSSATSTNNVVTANTTISSLTYTNLAPGNWQVTDIGAGVTLTVTNLTIGLASATNTDVAMLDAGTLMVNGNMTVGGLQTANAVEVLNLGGLSNFVFNASGGTINLGPANDCIVNFTLAGWSNNITAGTIDYNINASSSSTGNNTTFTLGGGTNIIKVGTFNFAYGRNTSTVEFPAGSTGGGLLLQGVGGNGTLANMEVGYHNTSGSGSHAFGTLSLDGNPVNMQLQTLTLGMSDHTPTGASYGEGILDFDTGTIYASNIQMAINVGAVANSGTVDAYGIGQINVGSTTTTANPTLIIGPGGLSLVNQTNLPILTACQGTLAITNGTVISSNSIVKTSTVGTGTIIINGGTLNMVAGTIGVSTNPIDSVAIDGALALSVSGTNTTALVYGSTVTESSGTIIITNVTQVTLHASIPLISYNLSDGDPGTNGLTIIVPNGYVGFLDDDGSGEIDLSISVAGLTISDLLWVGAVNGTLNSNWDIGITPDWTNSSTEVSSAYTNPDVVVFDDSASNPNVILKTNLTPSSLTFSNSVLNYSLSGTGRIGGPAGLVMDGSATAILSESGTDTFSGGVVINNNNGTVILDDANGAISGGLTISGGATAQIGTNDNHGSLPAGPVTDAGTLIFDHTTFTDAVTTAISGSGALTQNGSGTVSLSAVNGYTGATTVNAGTLALTGSGSISNSSSVTFNNAALNVSGLSGPTLMQNITFNNSMETLAMPSESTPLLNYSGSITLQGATNVVNVTVLPPIAYFPTTLTLMSGSINGTFNMGLGSLTNGYSGNVSEGPGGQNVLLTITSGPTGVRSSVSWVGADAASIGVTNWSDADNWMLPGEPTPVDNVDFADTGAASGTPFNSVGDGPGGIVSPQNVNNFVNTSFTVGTLTYTNVTSGDYQNTIIQNGAALNVVSNGSLVVGSESADYGASATIDVTIGGTNSTLNVNNTNGTMFVGMGSGNSPAPAASLDLSGLGTFNANVSRLLVGVGSGSEGIALSRLSGILYLAQTNTITASIAVSGAETSDTAANAEALDVGDCDGNAGNASFLYLGQTNAIYADAIAVGRQKNVATMEFNPNFTNCSAYFRSASASAVSTFSIGDGCDNSGSGENANGTCDFTATGGSDGYVNALIGTLYVGRAAFATSGSGTVKGTLTFDNGIFNVGTMFLGNNPTNGVKTANGTINVNTNSTLGVNGTLSVSGTLTIAQTVAGGTAATGVLNIGGGTVAANSIVCDANGGSSTVTVGNNSIGGILIVTNAIGAPGALLTTLNLEGGVLQLNPVNGATNIAAASVSISSPTTVNIASVGTAVGGPLSIPLISYTGSDPGVGNLIMGTAPPGYGTNNPAFTDNSGLISLNITAPPLRTWRGAVGSILSSNWDLNTTADWVGPSTFTNDNLVQFADGASNGIVNLTTALTPSSTTVTNNALAYSFIGTGYITGGPLTKAGAGLLMVDNGGANGFSSVSIAAGTVQVGNNDANGSLSGSISDNGSLVFDQSSSSTFPDLISGNGNISQYGSGSLTLSAGNTGFAGSVNVTNGTLVVGSATALGANTNTITISNGGTLDDDGQNLSSYTNITVSGSGVNGLGAIVNNGPAQQTAFGRLTLAGNTTFGGTNRWDVRLTGGSLLTGGKPYSITKVGTNQVSLVSAGTGTNALFTIDPALSNIIVQAGNFALEQIGTNGLGTNGSVIVYTNATLELSFGDYLTNTTKPIVLLDGATMDCANGANSLADPITLSTNIFGGPGNCTFAGSGTSMAWNNVVSGPGNLIQSGPVTLILTANNTYTGTTIINSNSLVLSGSGSITHSAGIAISGGGIFNVSGVSAPPYPLQSGQTLGNSTNSQTGTINGSMTTASGPGALFLYYTNGTPSLVETNGTLTLSSTMGATINNTGTQLAAGTYTVISTNTTGFIAGNAPSSVTVTGGGAAGTASLVVSNGVLDLVVSSGPAPRPVITSFKVTGTTLTISATNGEDNAMYSVYGTTNLLKPLSQWTLVFTNSFNASGNISSFSTNVVTPGVPDEFYLIEEP
jgi:fibronectin-binding autotransporter adhesin